jgi:hypothetical protein
MPALKYWDAGSNQYVLLMPGTPTTFPLIYTQTLSAPTVVSSPYQVNHNLGTTTPLVQAYDAVTGQLVMVAITVANSNSIQVSVSANMPNNINVVVVGTAQATVPVQPADVANKSYVDARTPNLPAPVTSGSGVQSFTDALGDVWVAVNGVYSGNWRRAKDVIRARVYRVAAFTAGAAGYTIVPYDTVSDDAFGGWTLGANALYTCPIAGRYSASARGGWAVTGATRGFISIYRQGGEAYRGTDISTTTASIPLSVVVTSSLLVNANDQLQARLYCSVASLVMEVAQILAYMDVQYIGPV